MSNRRKKEEGGTEKKGGKEDDAKGEGLEIEVRTLTA